MCTRDRHNARIQIHFRVHINIHPPVHIIGFALFWFTQLLLLCEQNTYSSHVCYVWGGSVKGSLILFPRSHSKQQVLLFFFTVIQQFLDVTTKSNTLWWKISCLIVIIVFLFCDCCRVT